MNVRRDQQILKWLRYGEREREEGASRKFSKAGCKGQQVPCYSMFSGLWFVEKK